MESVDYLPIDFLNARSIFSLVASQQDCEACAAWRAWLAVLWAALEALPFDQRTAVVLREFDGLSYEEIAFSLDIAVGTVKSRLSRGRETLRFGPMTRRRLHDAAGLEYAPAP